MSDNTTSDSKDNSEPPILALLKELGFVYSEENEAWMHSEFGTGFTSQIDVRVLKRIHDRLAADRAKLKERLDRSLPSNRVNKRHSDGNFEYMPEFVRGYNLALKNCRAAIERVWGEQV